MRIPIKQGSKPHNQAPYLVPPGPDATLWQEYLEEHGLVNPSSSEKHLLGAPGEYRVLEVLLEKKLDAKGSK